MTENKDDEWEEKAESETVRGPKAYTKTTKGHMVVAEKLAGEVEQFVAGDEDPFAGLTERQKQIARMQLRGISQKAIGKVLGVSQPMISKEMKKIRQHMAEKGSNIEQSAVVGRSLSIYEEVQLRAWEIYHKNSEDASIQLKALKTVEEAQGKKIKMLLDLGLMTRAPQQVEHSVSRFAEKWEAEETKVVAKTFIEATFDKLEDPEPPEFLEAEFQDVEKEEDK